MSELISTQQLFQNVVRKPGLSMDQRVLTKVKVIETSPDMTSKMNRVKSSVIYVGRKVIVDPTVPKTTIKQQREGKVKLYVQPSLTPCIKKKQKKMSSKNLKTILKKFQKKNPLPHHQ